MTQENDNIFTTNIGTSTNDNTDSSDWFKGLSYIQSSPMTGSYTTEEFELTKINKFDAGLDVPSNEDITIPPRSSILVHTGIKIAVPDNYVGLLWSRSGLSVKHKIEVGAGCIDATYRGELMVHLFNHSDEPFEVKKGDRIAQLITMYINIHPYMKVKKLDDTGRGDKGFGSTGK